MGVIQNFQKRQLALAVKSGNLPEKLKADVKPNSTLTLLAQLLQVNENVAIETAEKYIKSNITFFADFSDEPDKTVTAIVETNDKGDVVKITDIEEHEAVKETLAADITTSSDELANSANNVETAASSVETAASSIESSAEQASDAASNLAYTADDINVATEELKEATAAIKKPRAPRKSSTLKKKTARKVNSKK